MRRRRSLALSTLVAVAALAACGGDDAASDDIPEASLVPISAPGPRDVTKPSVDVPDEPPTELVVTDLVEGTGEPAAEGDTVLVDYVGVVTSSGTEFDASYGRAVPFDVQLGAGRVIPGWEEGLVGARVGATRQLDIPAELAYGDAPPGGSGIEPGDALTFVVEVRAVIPAVTAADSPRGEVDVTPSDGATEVTTVDVREGDGAVLEAGMTAIIHVLLIRGDNAVVLYDTWGLNEPLVIAGGQAMPGLVDGLAGMRVGGLRTITMPPDAAFGPEGNVNLGLPAGRDLIAVVELVAAY